MTLLTALRQIFRRPEAVDVTPGDDLANEMSPLVDRLASARGDKVTMGVALGKDDFGGRLAENANMARIVDHRDEDTIITG